MQAHLTKATSSVTYLLKMQSRAPWPALSELTELCWERAKLCWVWRSCPAKAVPGESMDHAGADPADQSRSAMSVILSSVLSTRIFYDEFPVTRQTLLNRGKTPSCCFSKFIKEQVWHSVAFYQSTCSRQRTVQAILRKVTLEELLELIN